MAKKKDDTVLADLALEELQERLSDDQTLLQRLKFNHEVTPLENPRVLGETRRSIARMKTEITRRQIKEANENEA